MSKKQINEANIYLASNAPLSDGRCKLMLDFSYDGIRLRMYTKETSLPEHYDKEKRRVNRKHPFQFETNTILDNYCKNVVAQYKLFKSKGIIPTKEQLKSAIKPKKKEEIANQTMGYYFDLLKRKQIVEGKSPNTQKNYTTLRNRLSSYERDRKIKLSFETFDAIRHTDFMEYLIYDIENQPNTIAKRNQCLKHFFSFCEELHGVKVNPFYRKIKVETVETQTIYLEQKELEVLEDLEIESYLEKVRDCYLFACYTGRRYSEVAKFTYDQLSKNEEGIEIMTFYEDKKIRKGNLTVALNEQALAIIDKYRTSNIYSKRNNYVLPTMTNQRMNKYIKELFKLAEIDSPVEKIKFVKGTPTRVTVPKYELGTFHTARHTYATLSIKKGMRVEVLQKELNHAKITQTMHYVEIVESQQHEEALKAWNKPKESSKEMEQIQKEINLDKLTNQILRADEGGVKTLTISYQLSKEAITDLQQKGFTIKDTSPIEKLKGMYHTISW